MYKVTTSFTENIKVSVTMSPQGAVEGNICPGRGLHLVLQSHRKLQLIRASDFILLIITFFTIIFHRNHITDPSVMA